MDQEAIERELERVGRNWKVIARELSQCQDSYRLSVLTQELMEALEPEKMKRVERELARIGERPVLVQVAIYPGTGEGAAHDNLRTTDRDESKVLG
jgi:hypothetical protein